MRIEMFWTNEKSGIDKGNERKFVLYKINGEEDSYLFAIGCGQPNFESHSIIHEKVIQCQHHEYHVLGGGMIMFISDSEVSLYGRSDHFGGVRLVEDARDWYFMSMPDQEKITGFLKTLSTELNNSCLYYEKNYILVVPRKFKRETIELGAWNPQLPFTAIIIMN